MLKYTFLLYLINILLTICRIEKVVDLREPNNDYINNINNKYKEKRSIGIQTLFRESSTQTDPASNLGQIERDGSFLEILELDSLSYGKGLPVSMYEIELISKMREKRAFNDALPPLSDESCFNLRRKITQEQEVREWASTEKEYKNENNKRLLKLQNILEKKEKDSEENRLKKIEELKTIKEEEVESFIIKTRKLRVKIIRQTGKQKENFNKKEKYKRDIIMEYASYGSKVYAPFTRDGSNPDRNSFKFEIQNDFLLKDFKGLNYLEQNLQKKNMLNPKSKPDDIISNSESNNKSTAYNSFSNDFNKLEDVSFNKYESNHIKALNNAFESIVKAENQKLLEKQLEEEKNREIMKKKEEKKAVEVKSNDVDYIEEIMLIQRLLKGRKEQNLMYKGKLKRRELIKELREADSYKQMSEETNVNISESNKYDNKINYYDKLTNSLIDANGLAAYDHTSDANSREIFSLIVGPSGVINQNQSFGTAGTPIGESIDVVPTIAHILGFYDDIPTGMLPGRILTEAFV